MVGFIDLRNGPIIREDAVLLALALEAEGRTMTVKGDVLTVSGSQTLTQAQRHHIYQCRRHLMALLAYQPPEAR